MAGRAVRGRHLATSDPVPRRWALAVAPVLLAVTAVAAGLDLDRGRRADPDPAPAAAPTTHAASVTTLPVAVTTTTPPLPPELPRGGRRLFPGYRVVGFYGMQNLDVLGTGPPEVVGWRLLRVARSYARPGTPVMPMFELIATIAHRFPTPSGLYRSRQDEVVQRYLQAVRGIDGILVLDVQPGRAEFVDELRHWERYLRLPDVGVALDPEFSMGPGQVPGRQVGRTDDAAAINRASAYVAGLVRRHRLPQKLFMIHQFRDHMVADKAAIATRPGLAMTWNADGFGVRSAKLEDYHSYTRDRRFHPGLKLFYDNDIDLMAPREVLRLEPAPRVINYQ
jgi:hypothetical protein